MTSLPTTWLLRDSRQNAGFAWFFVLLAVIAALGALLQGMLLRASGALLLVAVTVLPSVAAASYRTTFAWPFAVVVTLPAHFVAFGPGVVADLAAAVSLATFALAVVVDLHLVSDVRMSTRFTAFFVVVATMGFAGFWAVITWVADLYLGTGFVATGDELMVDLLVATAAGLVLAVGLERYARRQRPARGALAEGAPA